MPRYRRTIEPHSVQHVVTRFVNRNYLFDLDGARAEYLRRASRTIGRSDWAGFAYCLMSSHAHLALEAGGLQFSQLARALHTGFALWLNRVHTRLGPVFADRPKSITFDPEATAILVAYVHNNPVRARLVASAAESSWSSHRAFVGDTPAPPWLDVERALSFCGFDASPRGRWAFHDFVESRAGLGRDASLSGENQDHLRAQMRQQCRGPVEITTTSVERNGTHGLSVNTMMVRSRETRVWPKSAPAPKHLVDTVAEVIGVGTPEVRSKTRRRDVCRARKVALAIWTYGFGRPSVEMARYLGIASSSASGLLARFQDAPEAEARLALEVLATLAPQNTLTLQGRQLTQPTDENG